MTISVIKYMVRSQNSGFIFENIIRKHVFNLPEEYNNTDIYDIPCKLNKFDCNENISIKSTSGKNLDCADILRFYDYDLNKKNTIIILKYKQNTLNTKKICNIYEIDYNLKFHTFIFGEVRRDTLVEYVNMVKSIENGKVIKEVRKHYLDMKKLIEDSYKMKIKIRPKVDSKNQRRVQCSISNFEVLLENFIKYTSNDTIRNIRIPLEIDSGKRIRN